ncbi:hypothetical protein [Sediminitomix flava]|uniref:Uncharacterized protein n=1 Tax=Sediminitomix flava TaxID=379075 RepID=A0A315Z7Y9_SEDFL|nr:hypothetical protein [Sediminitomix flava]PWJ39310.1 hypothetical protein BC781_106211 [Sediminitomix flava]
MKGKRSTKSYNPPSNNKLWRWLGIGLLDFAVLGFIAPPLISNNSTTDNLLGAGILVATFILNLKFLRK